MVCVTARGGHGVDSESDGLLRKTSPHPPKIEMCKFEKNNGEQLTCQRWHTPLYAPKDVECHLLLRLHPLHPQK